MNPPTPELLTVLESIAALSAEERERLVTIVVPEWQAKVRRLRDVLEDARPIIKHAAVDGSAEASEVLDRINALLEP